MKTKVRGSRGAFGLRDDDKQIWYLSAEMRIQVGELLQVSNDDSMVKESDSHREIPW